MGLKNHKMQHEDRLYKCPVCPEWEGAVTATHFQLHIRADKKKHDTASVMATVNNNAVIQWTPGTTFFELLRMNFADPIRLELHHADTDDCSYEDELFKEDKNKSDQEIFQELHQVAEERGKLLAHV
jgi:hypothetical protein